MLKTIKLNKAYQPLNKEIANITHQFILSQNSGDIPDNWTLHKNDEWFLGTSVLPVIRIENTAGKKIGWCVGYPINYTNPWADKIVLESNDDECIEMSAVEKIYQDTAGRFILIFLTKKEKKLFLDPYGSLSAVFSTTEPIVASTTTLMGKRYDWNSEIILALNMPESNLWFPAGLTPRIGVKRLLPNHYLNLNNLKVYRHWPSDISELNDPKNIDVNVSNIIACLKKTIGIIAERYPLQPCLTAGRDSRIVLASTRDYIQNARFFTFSQSEETIDMHIASKLAKNLDLHHSFIPMKTATDDEMLNWLYLTGHAAGGKIWEIHRSLENYDSKSVLLNGIAAFGGAVGLTNDDLMDKKITATELLRRHGLPCEKAFVNGIEKWLSELSEYHTVTVVHLFYLEQKCASWAAPQLYSNIFSRFEISPFNHRNIYKSMMRLPYEYWKNRELPKDICLKLWPELLELPFNEFTGFMRYKKTAVHSTKKLLKKIIPEALSSKLLTKSLHGR